jgi:CMP-N-acetylneuraminic acid synthetase
MIVYIPIKVNSQRVLRKNFRLFRGKPLWEHCIDKFKSSNYELWVDTDSDEIVDACADKQWVNIHNRPDHLRGDAVSVVRLIVDFCNKMELGDNRMIAQLHVTSPFFNIQHIQDAVEAFRSDTAVDSVFSADAVQQRLWRNECYGLCPVNHNPTKLEQTQDLPMFYAENSYLYLFTAGVIRKGNRIGCNPLPLLTPYPNNLDIDTEEDWKRVLNI